MITGGDTRNSMANTKTKAHQRYRLRPTPQFKKGEIVPGVTTIIDELGWNKRALLGWSRREALAGNDPNKILEQAGDIGSVVHNLIEAHVKNQIEGQPYKYIANLEDFSQTDIAKGKLAFGAYLEWEKRFNLKYIASEFQFVSEAYRYGGTIDILAEQNSRLWLIDAKSGKGIWAEQKIQAIAYKYGYEQTNSQIYEIHLVHLDKETGEFKADIKLTQTEIIDGWQVFQHCRALYDLHKKFGG